MGLRPVRAPARADGARLAIADGNVIPALDWAQATSWCSGTRSRSRERAGPFAFAWAFARPSREDHPGVNAIFRVAGGGETRFTPVLRLQRNEYAIG